MEPIHVGGAPTGVAVGRGKVWISVQPAFRSVLASGAGTVRVPGTVSEPFCSGVEFAGEGAPRFLIVSDYPLQHGAGSVPDAAIPTDAVRFVLARRHFRAGRYSVGYQSCDDSTIGSGGPTPGRVRPAAGMRGLCDCARGWSGSSARSTRPALAPDPHPQPRPGGPLAEISGSTTASASRTRGRAPARREPDSVLPARCSQLRPRRGRRRCPGRGRGAHGEAAGVRSLFVLEDKGPTGSGSDRRWFARPRGSSGSHRRVAAGGPIATAASSGWPRGSSAPGPTACSSAASWPVTRSTRR